MRHERKFILVFCAVAAVRVLIFCAAFPFFNNVDEQAHVDLVIKYARGEVPRDLGHYSSESAKYLSLYGSPEYFTAPEQFATGMFPPPNWTLPAEQRDAVVNSAAAWWRGNQNHESGEPPVYYAVAGLWLNLGRLFGLSGAWLLYWVRFLNVFVAALVVWIGFLAAKLLFPDEQFILLSVPLLLALWPQTALYSITSDSLSPLCFGVAFLGLLKILDAERPSSVVTIWTGLALAATYLVQAANVALVFVAGLALMFTMRHVTGWRELRRVFAPVGLLIGSASFPIACWFAWNLHTFGDLTAVASKVDFLDWTPKPVNKWWPHPIFTFVGLKEFWAPSIASFWRGEFIWHGQRLASQLSDEFYWISSTLVILFTAIVLICRPQNLTVFQRRGLWLAWSSLVVLVIFLAVLSIAFDFGSCVYPSREHPYFTSGRLLSAAAVPFFLLYSYTLDRAFPGVPRIILFSGIVLFILISEFSLSWPAFSSRHNFFHLASLPLPPKNVVSPVSALPVSHGCVFR
jgi:Predicted membrane protein (DUF2142)